MNWDFAGARWACSLAVMTAAACGGGGRNGDARFPTAGEIDAIGQAPRPAHIATSSQVDVPSWKLKDIPAAQPGNVAHAPTTPVEKLLADEATRRQGLLWASEPMHCLAHQKGLFLLANGGDPADDLTRIMAARCGAAEGDVSISWLTGKAPASMTDDQVFAANKSAVEQLITQHVHSGNQIAGIWAGRDKDKTVVALAFVERRVRLDNVPSRPDDKGHVTIRGEVLIPTESLQGLSNYGKYGFRQCVLDAKERLPKFTVDCEVNPADPAAVIEVAAFPPGRITGRIVARLVVWPAGQPTDQYDRAQASLNDSSGDATSAQSLVLMLNQIRAEAGLAKVTLATEESATAAKVAPHFFAALTGATSEVIADRVILGLRAGWQVAGLIGEGHFASSLTRDIQRPSALLLSALSGPSGRETLLDPKIKVVAVGQVMSREEGVIAGVFSSYSLLEPSASPGEVAEVMAVLNQKRSALHLPPATLVSGHQPQAGKIAHRLETGESTVDQALNGMMQELAASGAAVKGWFVGAGAIDKLSFPDELVKRSKLQVAIGVAHYKPEGEPWGSYAVLVATTESLVAENSVARPKRALF